MNSLNTPSTTATTTTTAVHFSRRARTSRNHRRLNMNISRVARYHPVHGYPSHPRMVKANPQVDLKNNQPNAFKKTFPIHGSVGSVLTGDEESKCIDLSHEISTVTDATAGVVSSGGVGGFGLNSLTRADGVIPPGMAVNTDCISDNLDTTGVEVSTAYGSNTMTVAGVVLSDEVSRVYSNSLMQLDNTSFPEIVVGMGWAVRVNSSNPTRQNGSSSPEVAVKGMCVGKKIVADSRVRVRKPRGGKVMAAAAGIHSDEPTTRLDDTISDSLLLVSREHYFEQ
ncbi:hypothetical protein BASA61_005875 [Batrachochytrium salamandrivorans]|nr:hypothetical protein BASA61_005875 [Batrachochytrium salamandrivorans]